MSSQQSSYLVHAMFNKLTIVLGKAELVSLTSADRDAAEAARSIKEAALSMKSLLVEFAAEQKRGAEFTVDTEDAGKMHIVQKRRSHQD